jgi:hypothetical protein
MHKHSPEVDPIIAQLINVHFPDMGNIGIGRLRAFSVEMSAVIKSRLVDELMEQQELDPLIEDQTMRAQIAGQCMAAFLTHESSLKRTPDSVAGLSVACADALLRILQEGPANV